jgi:hypothetical protein
LVWPPTDEFEDSVHKKLGAETMSKQTRVSRPIYGLPPTEFQKFDSLAEFAPFWDNVSKSGILIVRRERRRRLIRLMVQPRDGRDSIGG